MKLNDSFTSTGLKFFNHPDALEGLRNGSPRVVVTHIMSTDICQHTCAFCSVATRDGNSLTQEQITGYIDQLIPVGLKSVILSGGGNPILYKENRITKDKKPWDFNDLVDYLHGKGLEIGVITNGLKLKEYPCGRKSWLTVRPETLDKLTWVRISMSGLDHNENEVYVPDIDKSKTTLGFSYVAHDIYTVPNEPNHGKVSTKEDLDNHGGEAACEWSMTFEERYETIQSQIKGIVEKYMPSYVRLLPNCLEVNRIADRCKQLQKMANSINPKTVFVQFKPPEAPSACYLGYLHPVLNSDGYVYPCDSCVLNKAAGHKFAVPWRMCRWDEIGNLYAQPARSLIKDPRVLCPGCVFTKSNQLLTEIVNGRPLEQPQTVEHPNFV